MYCDWPVLRNLKGIEMNGVYERVRMGRGERSEWRMPKLSFTLVELLVIIAIMSILMALLMPSVRGVIKSGYQVSCANNLKQCGIGIYTYSDNFNGSTINFTGEGRAAKAWPDQLMVSGSVDDIGLVKYFWGKRLYSTLPANNIYSCPSSSPPSKFTISGGTFLGVHHSAVSFGVRPHWLGYKYPTERMRSVETWTDLIFGTCNPKIPFLGDSIQFWAPDYLPGQGVAISFDTNGFDLSSFFLTAAGCLYIGHGQTGNAWYSDGHVSAKTAPEYSELKRAWDQGPILAFPCIE